MGKTEIKKILKLAPHFINYPTLWTSYDAEADVLYIDFKKPSHADDSEMTEDDMLIRYEHGEIIGITVLNAKKRNFK